MGFYRERVLPRITDIACGAKDTRVTPIEPARPGWELADKRVKAATVPVQWSGPDGQHLSLPDDSFDAALSTWSLCTIPDVAASLTELRRVLKPSGSFHFLDHGLASDEPVRRWQRRLDPVRKGCSAAAG